MTFHWTLCTHNRRKGALLAAAAGALIAGSASAADLGGSCCSDLEERIAELEATTARKSTRTVSLTFSGYIAQEITFWDDGTEQNAYIHGLGPTQASNLRFGGQATIAPGWTAGYLLRMQDLSNNPFGRDGVNAMNQNSATFSSGMRTQMSHWYLQGKDYGKVSVGIGPQAAKSAVMFTDQSGTQIFDHYTFLDGFPQFFLRPTSGAATALTWGNMSFCYSQQNGLGGDCNGIVLHGVRYDSPAFAGFTLSASWGEDDFWEVATRYAGEVGGFKILAAIGYSTQLDEGINALPGGAAFVTQKETNYFQAGGYIQHLASGLFVHAAYGFEDNNGVQITNGVLTRTLADGEHVYVKAGIRSRVLPLGATIMYGDYAQYFDQLGPGALFAGATGSTLTRMGGGIAQELDAAAMTLYVKYQHLEGELSGAGLAAPLQNLNDANFVSMGGLINF